MADATVILHGWSDCSDSFRSLETFLVEEGIGEVESVYFADYESREDTVTYEDVVGGLDDELRRRGLVDARGRGSFDVVVHSAGALVIRHWIWRYYADRIGECPVQNLVMLAPANFGSPLAHRGKSLLGRMLGGRWKVGDMLEAGRRLLDGLELASAHQWKLAHRDLLGEEPFYDDDRIRLTVLVGLDDYEGLRGWVTGKAGTDGAVVIAGTAPNAVKLSLDVCDPETPLLWERETQHGDFAFGVLAGHDHGSVVDAFGAAAAADRAVAETNGPEPYGPEADGPVDAARGDGGGADPLPGLVLSALRVDSAEDFRRHRRRVDGVRRAAYGIGEDGGGAEARTRWQQFLFHAVDDQDRPVRDFTLEFLVHRRGRETRPGEVGREATRGPRALTGSERRLSREADRLMTSRFHAYSRDPSYRRTLVDPAAVERLLPDGHVLAMRMHVPRVDDGIYYDTGRVRNVVVHDPAAEDGGETPSFFYPNTTTLVQLRVDRVTDYVTVRPEPRER